MAVTAAFVADFSGFNGPVDAGTAKLHLFKGATVEVNSSLGSMTGAMSKFGGSAGAHVKLVEGMSAAGRDAAVATGGFGNVLKGVTPLLGAFGISLGVGAIVGFGKSLLSAADGLEKLHDKTGLSFQGLQKLQIAGDDAGNTIEQLTSAVTQFQNRLAGGDKSALQALDKLGLKLSDIKAMSPERQFMAIGEAVAGIEDPAKRVNVAMDLFGRSGAEILPTLIRNFDDLKDASVGMSDEAVKGLGALNDAIGRFWRGTKATVGESISGILTYLTSNKIVTALSWWNKQFQMLTGSTEDLLKAVSKMGPPTRDLADAADVASLSMEEQAAIERELDQEHQRITASAKTATKATREFEDTQKAFRKSAAEATDELTRLTLQVGRYIANVPGAKSETLKFAEAMATLESEALDVAGVLVGPMPAAMAVGDDAFRRTGREVDTLASRIEGNFQSALSRIPQMFIDAFTGGGGVMGALKGIGVSLLDAILSEILKPIINAVAGWAGDIAGRIAGAFSGAGGGASSLPSLGGGGIGLAAGIGLGVVGGMAGMYAADVLSGQPFGYTEPSGWINGVYVPPAPLEGSPTAPELDNFHPSSPIYGYMPYEFATGTKGRLLDFGAAGTDVRLHNKEQVVTEGEVNDNVAVSLKILDALERMAKQQRNLPRQMRDAVMLAG